MQYLKHLQSELSESLWISHREPNKQRDSTIVSSRSTTSTPGSKRTQALVNKNPEKQTFRNQHLTDAIKKKVIIEGRDFPASYSPDEIRSFPLVITNNNKETPHLRVHSSVNPHTKVISSLRTQPSSVNVLHSSSDENRGNERVASGSSLVEPVILSLTPLSKSIRKEYYESRSSSLDKEEFTLNLTTDHLEGRQFQHQHQIQHQHHQANNLLVVVDDPLLHVLGVGPLLQEEKKDQDNDVEKSKKIIFVASNSSFTSPSPPIKFAEGKTDKGQRKTRRSSIAISTRSFANIFRPSRQIHSSRDRVVDNANIQTISKRIQDRQDEEGRKAKELVIHQPNFFLQSEENTDPPKSLSEETEKATSRRKGLDFYEILAPEDPHNFASRFTASNRDGTYSSSDSSRNSSRSSSRISNSYSTDSDTSTRTSVTLQESEEKAISENSGSPVVVYNNQKFGLPLPRIGSVEGVSCSYKVNQKKKIISNNSTSGNNGNTNNNHHNNSNLKSNNRNGNSETKTPSVPTVTKRGSIIHYLLCTGGQRLSCTPKYLLKELFSPSRQKQRLKQRKQNKRKSDTTPIFSLCFPRKFDRRENSNSNSNHRRRRRSKKHPKLRKVIHSASSLHGKTRGGQLTKSEQRLWVRMDHEDLIRELPQIEKLSNQERLRLAHKRRMLQLKRFQQYEKELNSNSKKHRGESDLVRRNLPGKHNNHVVGRKGSRRIRFRNSIMLLEAAGRNDVEEVRLLLESGVNPDVANEDGLTALHQCCIDDNEEMMKLLLDYGANVNSEDSEKWTPLHAAATCGHLHLVQYLIARGANLLAVNAEGNMPYDICDDETTLDYIESEMAKRGVTQELIEEIRALPETRMLQDMQRIHTHGGDLECRDPDGATPLHIASANGYYRVAEFLLDNHAATDVQDKDFWQPIHAAACWGHLDVLELLVQNGADLDARTKNNETPYAICEDPEIKERIIQLRTEQQTKRQNEGRKRPSRTHSTNSRTQSIRRTSQRDKGLTSKRDAADEAQMLRAREEHHKENSPSPISDGVATTGANNNTTSVTIVNGNGVEGNGTVVQGQNNIVHLQNGNTSSEEDPELTYPPPPILGRDSVSNMKMKQDEMNRLREIAVRSGAMNHNNHLNNQNNLHNNSGGNNTGANTNGTTGEIKMNNLLYNESNGSLLKNQNNIHKNLNNASNGAPGNAPVGVLSSPDDNGNLLPKPEINPSVDNKVPLGGGLSSGMSLSGSRDNLVGLNSSAGNSTIDIHVSVTINTNSPVSTLTNGASSGGPASLGLGHGHNSPTSNHIPLSPGSTIFTPPGTLSDLKKQRSLIRTSSNPLTNGTLTNYIAPSSRTVESSFLSSNTSCTCPTLEKHCVSGSSLTCTTTTTTSTSGLMTFPTTASGCGIFPAYPVQTEKSNSSNSVACAATAAAALLVPNPNPNSSQHSNLEESSASSWNNYWNEWRSGFPFSQSQFHSSAFTNAASNTNASSANSPVPLAVAALSGKQQEIITSSLSSSNNNMNICSSSNISSSNCATSTSSSGLVLLPPSASSSTLFPLGCYYFNSNSCSNINSTNTTASHNHNNNNSLFSNNQHYCSYLTHLTGGMNDAMTKYHPPASPTMSLRRYVGDPSETVGDYGDGGKRCCVIV